MTVGELVAQLQMMNQNLLIKSLKIFRDATGEHVTYAMETTPSGDGSPDSQNE